MVLYSYTLDENHILYNENINLSTINNTQLNSINELKGAGKELVKRVKTKDIELSNQSAEIYSLTTDLDTLTDDIDKFSNEHSLNFEKWQHNQDLDYDIDMNS